MPPEEFIRTRYDSWQKLESLLALARRRTSRLAESDVRALGDLYRAATSDLARAQRDYPNHEATRYLNTLVGRAHHLVYRGARPDQGTIRDFFLRDVPQLYRLHLPYMLVAALLLFGPWIAGGIATANNPELGYTIAPQASGAMDYVKNTGELWLDIPPEVRALVGADVMTNNIQVTLLAFAGGLTAGLLTIYVLLTNGVTFGAVFGFVQAYGLSPGLWDFVTAHAPLELSVICMAGGAGLRIGHSMIVPGLLSRRAALEQAVPRAIRLMIAGALLLVIAGLIEGNISPSDLPYRVKLAVAIVTGLAMHGWLLLGGRRSDST